MLTNLYVSNYAFVDDRGLSLQLDRINIILGFPSIKETLFMAPCILDGIMSNLSVHYTSQRVFGSFDELVYDGTVSKPTTIYLHFEKFRQPLHESFYSMLLSVTPSLLDKYSEELKSIEKLDLYLDILGDKVNSLQLSINEHITFSIMRRESAWLWKIEVDGKVLVEKDNVFPAINFNALMLGIRSSLQYFDIRSWLIDRYQSLSTDSQSSIVARKLISLFSEVDKIKKIGEFMKKACGTDIRLRYIPPSSLGIEYRLSNSWKKTNFYDTDLIVAIPALATIFGNSKGGTIILSEISILSPKVQEALFELAKDVVLTEDKQIIFLTNSPILIQKLIKDKTMQKFSRVWIVYHEDGRAQATSLKLDENGLHAEKYKDKLYQFWTEDIIKEFVID
ncbi:MAG: hypothetical protein NDP13_04110 [Crenarchaeota archaeon]|nr:hypothetical protein [Thermoproteota archaeon]MCR8455535.1 hypothetical protein [Thermoproteota archaeon]MCR8501675.1 hypothetical protein [Thermoproteota archaeon]